MACRRRQPDWWRQVAYSGTKLLYQPEPKPVVYIVPVKNILGRSALVPYGSTGRFRTTGTLCSVLIILEGCVMLGTGLAAGAGYSISIPGPWYGPRTMHAAAGMGIELLYQQEPTPDVFIVPVKNHSGPISAGPPCAQRAGCSMRSEKGLQGASGCTYCVSCVL